MTIREIKAGNMLSKALEEAHQRIQPWYYDPQFYSLRYIASLSGVSDALHTGNADHTQKR